MRRVETASEELEGACEVEDGGTSVDGVVSGAGDGANVVLPAEIVVSGGGGGAGADVGASSLDEVVALVWMLFSVLELEAGSLGAGEAAESESESDVALGAAAAFFGTLEA